MPASTCVIAERILLLPVVVLLSACGAERAPAQTGAFSGEAQCEVFLPGLIPPDFGDGVVQLVLDSHDAASAAATHVTLAQGAAAFAVDANGSQTIDPSLAAYFSIQMYQYTSPTRVELFEVRVPPSEWGAGDVILDGTEAFGIYGAIEFDANGNATSSRILARTTDGVVHLTAAGKNPREPVAATFSGKTRTE